MILKRDLTLVASLSFFVFAQANPVRADVIFYQDTFSRTGSFFGSSPEIVGVSGNPTWGINIYYLPTLDETNGSVGRFGGAGVKIPFVAESGYRYTLSADIAIDSGGLVGQGGGIGFFPSTSYYPNPNIYLRSEDQNGSDVTTVAYNPYDFSPGTAVDLDLTPFTNVGAMKIVLDTSAPGWTADFFLNDSLIRSHTYSINPEISFVGIHSDWNGSVDNFILTQSAAVPEPSAFLLLTVAAGGVALRRRFKNGHCQLASSVS